MFVDVVKDFGVASVLLLLGYLVREKVKLFQKLYIPASVIGGILGLLLGGSVLGKICPVYLHFSDYVASYSMPLLAGVFCTQFFGIKLEKRILRNAAAIGVLNILCIVMQVLVGIGVVYFFTRLTHADIPLGMGMLPFSGFYGGHGVPAILGMLFEGAGYWSASEATSLGNTFATFGLIYGVVVGIAIINIAVRKGDVASNAGTSSLDESELSGYIQPEKQTAAMTGITKGAALNPIALHFAVVGAVLAFGYLTLGWVQKLPGLSNMTITGTAMLIGLLFAVICNKTKLKNYIEREALLNISGLCLEYLIVTSLAITNLSVFVKYGVLIILLTVILLPLTTFVVLRLAKRWQRENWVENAVGTFGLATGVLATGFLLVRISDPDMKTDAPVNLATGSLISGIPVQIPYLFFFPGLLMSNPTKAVILTAVILVICYVGGNILFGRKKRS